MAMSCTRAHMRSITRKAVAPEPISPLKKLNWPRVQRSIPNRPSSTAANTAAPLRVYSSAKPVAASMAAQITTNAITLNRLTR